MLFYSWDDGITLLWNDESGGMVIVVYIIKVSYWAICANAQKVVPLLR